jgi:serine/threonine protein kinase/5'-deoxynucleotidase YfbR-like HD superfamily hydrolase
MEKQNKFYPTIPNYEIISEVGRGGCGVVYRATHSKKKQEVAIKLHLEDSSKDNRFRDQLLKEALIWYGLTHPHIVRLIDCGYTDESKLFVVSELIDGKNLRQTTHSGSFEIPSLLSVAIHICDALNYLHTEKILHLDVKPENILVAKNGEAFLSDFGFAIHSTEKSKFCGGTPGYMSPEQKSNNKKAISHKSDIYSLGVVIKELVDIKENQIKESERNRDPDQPFGLKVEGVSETTSKTIEKLKSIYLKALQIKPSLRFESAEHMRLELAKVQEEHFASENTMNRSSHVLMGNSTDPLAYTDKGSGNTIADLSADWTSRMHEHVGILQRFNDEAFRLGVKKFSALMEHVVEIPDEIALAMKKNGMNLCECLAHMIIDKGNFDRSILISGAPGTGKSSLLAMLATATRKILSTQRSPIPHVDYINIHELDEICRGNFASNRDTVEARISEIVTALTEKFKGHGGFLFLDGLERHKRDRVPETQNQFINKCKRIKSIKIIGVGEYDGIEHAYDGNERNAEEIPFSGISLRLRSVRRDNLLVFCKDFVDFHRFIAENCSEWQYPDIEPEKLYQRIMTLGINRIDFLRLDVMAVVDDARSQSFSSALESYCEKQFEKQLSQEASQGEETIKNAFRDAAECVFQIFVIKNHEFSKRYAIRCWGFVTGHPAIRNFFIAKHVIQTLHDIGENIKKASKETKKRAPYNFVKEFLGQGLDNKLYPFEVNSHCKYFLNTDKLDNIMLALEQLLTSKSRELYYTATIHLCYLIGRVKGRNREALRILKHFITNKTKGDRNEIDKYRDENYLLECTYLISLICLEPEQSHIHTEKFLELLNDKDWAGNAIGFHLMYYGDHDFDFAFPKSLRPVPLNLSYLRLLDAIESRIFAIVASEVSWYPLFDVDVAILSLLLISRQGLNISTDDSLIAQSKKRAIRVLESVRDSKNSRVTSRPVLPLAKFALLFSQRDEVTEAFDIITKFYECKYDTQRAGWLNKIRIEGRIESVADHSFGAMLLAEIILPESLPKSEISPEYSKAEVIRCLLIHDLAEAYTGDRPSDTRGQENRGIQRRQELDFIELISFLGVTDTGHSSGAIFGFENLVDRWKIVENRSNINGRIANFFDKLDAYIQFIVYSKYYFDQSNHQDTVGRWRQFLDVLRKELNSSVDELHFLRNLSIRVVSWGTRVFDNGRPYLPHSEIFSDYYKYYPSHNKEGFLELITRETHSSVSKKRENTNRDSSSGTASAGPLG